MDVPSYLLGKKSSGGGGGGSSVSYYRLHMNEDEFVEPMSVVTATFADCAKKIHVGEPVQFVIELEHYSQGVGKIPYFLFLKSAYKDTAEIHFQFTMLDTSEYEYNTGSYINMLLYNIILYYWEADDWDDYDDSEITIIPDKMPIMIDRSAIITNQ